MDIITAQRLHKEFDGHTALQALDVRIPQGSVFGLLGPNGAGKTTFIRLLTRILLPDSGEVFFKGEPLGPPHARRMGYMPEERGLYRKMGVSEQLVYLARLKGMDKRQAKEQAASWLERMGLQQWGGRQLQDLSKGMQQKVQFIATVIHAPELIILDEPFSGFDPLNADLMKAQLRQLHAQGATIVFSTHRMESVEELCDHLLLLNQGEKLLEGSVREVRLAHQQQQVYALVTDAPLRFPEGPFRLLRTSADALGRTLSYVHLQERPLHELLSAAMAQTQVHAVQELLPSIHDIFVKAVRERQNLSSHA